MGWRSSRAGCSEGDKLLIAYVLLKLDKVHRTHRFIYVKPKLNDVIRSTTAMLEALRACVSSGVTTSKPVHDCECMRYLRENRTV